MDKLGGLSDSYSPAHTTGPMSFKSIESDALTPKIYFGYRPGNMIHSLFIQTIPAGDLVNQGASSAVSRRGGLQSRIYSCEGYLWHRNKNPK